MWSCAGIVSLDVSQSAVVDGHLTTAVTSLPALRTLVANQCRKLTPAISALFPLPSAGPPGVLEAHLESFCVQRCFQLTASTLHQVATGAGLRMLSISHVDLSSLPLFASAPAMSDCTASLLLESSADITEAESPGRSASAEEDASTSSLSGRSSSQSLPQVAPPTNAVGGALTVLALHCCTRVSHAALKALATTAPNLEMLFLGGAAVLTSPAEHPDNKLLDAVAAAVRQVHLQGRGSGAAEDGAKRAISSRSVFSPRAVTPRWLLAPCT